ncbi:hypothetical protein G7046_g2193 [Stylonectria norvegica]|nr:hypothetical protein G7046_g2193 [Stylonectria norvegica]
MVEVSAMKWVTIKTTLPRVPLPLNDERQIVKTARLILRPFNDSDSDLTAFFAIRSQPDVMIWSIQGEPDVDIDAARKNLASRLPPHDTTHYDWAICLASTGEVIGFGGSCIERAELGWPAVGYMLRQEAWGKGYATEFLKAFLDSWWALPREEVEIEVDEDTVRGAGEVKDEFISAVTLDANGPSQGVMKKAGFEVFKVFQEEDPDDKTKLETLYGFVLKRPNI